MRAQIEVGQQVDITADAFPGRSFTGDDHDDRAADQHRHAHDHGSRRRSPTRTSALLPGMFVNAAVVLPPQPDVVGVPETAVDYTLYGDCVFVVREEGSDAERQARSLRPRAPSSRPARASTARSPSCGRQGGRAGRRRRPDQAAERRARSPSPATRRRTAGQADRESESKLAQGSLAMRKVCRLVMKFTDIFISRPVLALVVSLLILLIGLQAMLGPADPPVSRSFRTR